MLETVLAILVILWLLGFVRVPGLAIPNLKFFVINGRPVTLFDFLTALVFIWLINLLPSPFKEIGVVLFVLYLLSIFGFIVLAGFSQIVVVTLIVATIIYLFQKK